jgi:hypothetical protein
VVVDGVANQRACLLTAQSGMKVESATVAMLHSSIRPLA